MHILWGIEKAAAVCGCFYSNIFMMYAPAITFEIDVENKTVDVTSYEQSGLGLYEEYDDCNQKKI